MEALVDLWVVEQREVVGASYVMSVLVAEGDPPGLALTAGAGPQDEDVAEQASERVLGVAGDGC